MEELKKTYARLNVPIDHYHGESMYGNKDITDRLEAEGLLGRLEDGRQVVEAPTGQKVVVTKSDGSSLYITRDVAAAIHRQDLFKVNVYCLNL